ncbi:DUF4132 domain-containing protein [Mycolicibacterium frederiksbergense]|uniref:DUF4132 domain-containing protein n=1 Tax=Mycolicibacterium frederiksbergense TaxID=117567 RepID=UPI002474730D|nr:DUF4132 domain-containing protein [Mycolicibacterium frederiksbergense]
MHLDDKFVAAALPTRAHPPSSVPEPDWQAAMDELAASRYVIDLDRTDPAIRDTLVSARSRAAGQHTRAERAVLLASARGSYDTRGVTARLLHAIAAENGLLEAVHTLVESLRISRTQFHDGYGANAGCYLLNQPDTRQSGHDPLDSDLAMLRQLACLASDDEYAQVVAAVRAAAPHLAPARRAGFALALPDTPDLSDELITEFADSDETWLPWLQATAADPELIDKARPRKRGEFGYGAFEYATGYLNALVVNLGSAALGTLLPHVTAGPAADALARIGLPEVIRALADTADASKPDQLRLRAAIDRWPAAAIAGLAQAVGDSRREAPTSRAMLASLVATHPELADAVRPWLSGGAVGVLDSITEQVGKDYDEAAADELPRVLADPPWLRPKPKSVLVEGLEPLPLPPVARWREGQREQWARRRRSSRAPAATGDPGAGGAGQGRLRGLLRKLNSPGRVDVTAAEVAGVTQAMCDEYSYSNSTPLPPELQQKVAAALHTGDVEASVTAYHAWAQAYRAKPGWTSATVNGELLCGDSAEVLDRISPEFGLRLWNALAGSTDDDAGVTYVLAQHGIDALPGLVSVVRRRPTEYLSTAIVFGAVELAPLAARAFRMSKTLREEAGAWLRTHPQHAAAGLIPAAIGKPGEARDNAATALRAMAAQGSRELILSTAAGYGRDDVSAAVTAMLDEDPTDLYPTKRSKLPAFWAPAAWRRPKLHSGKALTTEAVNHLGTMLAFPTADGVYAGIGHVVDACTAESLADFGWDLFSAWLAAGAPSKDSWAMTSLGLFGNDDTARRFTPLVRVWPGESQHKRAVVGLDVLAGIGSDVALMMLNGIANKVKFKALQERAREKITQIADARGLTTAELEDRLAPDLGLEPDGTMLLDFGPRQFLVGFDEALKPFVRDADGARLKELPKARRDDDAELAKAATDRWKALKKDARTVASQQVLRLELAMCARRRWSLPVFEQFLAGHPLVRHLVRRLVWAAYTDTGIDRCFRVAEDGQYTDADDDPITLPDDAIIGLPHALELPETDAIGFGQLFTDYELLQPFTQLGRDTYRLTEAEQTSTELTRWKDLVVPTGKVLGLTNRGWERGIPMDAGAIYEMEKPLPDGWKAIAELSDGITVGAVDLFPEQSVTRVTVSTAGRWDRGDQRTFDKLDEITASELLRDLEGLRG